MADNAAGERNQPDNAGEGNQIKLSCSTEYKEYSYNQKHDIWTLVSLKAPCQEEDEDDDNKRAPIDIVAVIDKSGSMAGSKLKLVKSTLEFVLTQLNAKDRLSIVTYDTNVYLDYPLQPMNQDNKKNIQQKIQNIRDGSSTNLCGGLMKGLCQIIDRGDDKNDVASVLLFTDGLANSGIRSAEGIVQAMKDPKRFDGPSDFGAQQQQQQQQSVQRPHQSWLRNVFQGRSNAQPQQVATPPPPLAVATGQPADATVYTFGFGEDHNPDMLKKISDAGNGMYYYIENQDKIAESFGHCLGGLLSTVAQGIQLQVLMKDGVVIKEVHSGKPFEQAMDKKSVKINMGDLQSEEGRDIVLELTIDSVTEPMENPPQHLFDASCDYFNVVSSNLENVVHALNVIRSEKPTVHDATTSNVRVNKERTRVKMASVMRKADLAADSGNLEEARGMLQKQIVEIRNERSRLRRAPVENSLEFEEIDDVYNNMEKDLDECSGGLSSSAAWMSKGKKLNMNLMQQHMVQRSSNADSSSYVTNKKAKSKSAAKSFVSKK